MSHRIQRENREHAVRPQEGLQLRNGKSFFFFFSSLISAVLYVSASFFAPYENCFFLYFCLMWQNITSYYSKLQVYMPGSSNLQILREIQFFNQLKLGPLPVIFGTGKTLSGSANMSSGALP